MLFCKWKVYEFCLFEGASFQKQGFCAHSGMAKFSLFGASLKQSIGKKFIAWNVMGAWSSRVELVQAWFCLMVCTCLICISDCSVSMCTVARGSLETGSVQLVSVRSRVPLLCCSFCARREDGGPPHSQSCWFHDETSSVSDYLPLCCLNL